MIDEETFFLRTNTSLFLRMQRETLRRIKLSTCDFMSAFAICIEMIHHDMKSMKKNELTYWHLTMDLLKYLDIRITNSISFNYVNMST